MTIPNVISITELARQQGCSRQAIYNAIHRGDLNTARLGSQTVVVRDEKFRNYSVRELGGRLHERYRQVHQRGEDI